MHLQVLTQCIGILFVIPFYFTLSFRSYVLWIFKELSLRSAFLSFNSSLIY